MKRGGFSSYGPPLGDAIFAHEYITTSKKMPISARMLFLINCGFIDSVFYAMGQKYKDMPTDKAFKHLLIKSLYLKSGE